MGGLSLAFKQYKANLGIWGQSKEIGAADVFLLILLTCWGLIILPAVYKCGGHILCKLQGL